MPWISVIIFILTFIIQKRAGRSNASAALTGLAAGGLTYYLADPTNPDNLFQIGVDGTQTGGVPDEGPSNESGSSTNGWATVAGQTVSSTGEVLKSWGPTGTALVAGSLTAGSNMWLWLAIGAGALLLLKD
jgi:hypothetical protein